MAAGKPRYHSLVSTGANKSNFTSTPNPSNSLSGSFFGPNAAETGGNFSIKKPIDGFQYIASGIFTGRR